MEVSAASNTTSTPTQQSSQSTQKLDKQAFLQILVDQMRYQNPMKPQDSSAFINQMVQLSTMESMANLTSTIEDMQRSQEFNTAAGFIGKEVKLCDENDNIVQGTVEKVATQDGEPLLVVGGSSYKMDRLVSVINNDRKSLEDAAYLVGKEVTVSGEVQGTVEEITLEDDGALGLVVNGTKYDMNQLQGIRDNTSESSQEVK
ncbi:MAG: hypothetical protein K9L17_03355 [Clostridiales bacterium]|nr:hypothetical protein [Clostridiales bacterium]MCF8021716.1 hypothetical protein [Clostridiales bacterium]